jgi:hypothetical protein
MTDLAVLSEERRIVVFSSLFRRPYTWLLRFDSQDILEFGIGLCRHIQRRGKGNKHIIIKLKLKASSALAAFLRLDMYIPILVGDWIRIHVTVINPLPIWKDSFIAKIIFQLYQPIRSATARELQNSILKKRYGRVRLTRANGSWR